MVAILADIIILALILGYCAYLVYGIVKRFKNGVIQGCGATVLVHGIQHCLFP